MKKLLAFALVAVSFVACNDATTKTETTTTDTAAVVIPVAADTAMVVTDSTVKTTVTKDTTIK